MKKLLAVIAAAAVALTLVGCVVDEEGVNWNTYTKDKQNKIAYYAQIYGNSTLQGSWYVPGTTFFEADDSEGAITGFNQNYTVDYTNSTDKLYRAYKETALKHAGAIIKVTFNSANVSASKMGVIFDLKANDKDANAKDFYIIGLNPRTDVPNFYVSKFTNVTDFQAENFGTKAATNPAKEVEIVALNNANKLTKIPAADADGKINFYVYYKLMADGSFDWAVLDLTEDQMNDFKSNDKFNKAKLDDYTVLAKGNTLAKCGAEYEAAPVAEKKSLF